MQARARARNSANAASFAALFGRAMLAISPADEVTAPVFAG